MGLWSAALFGHYKPKVNGWEKRAQPGDIIAVRPIAEQSRWTDTERREFLIVTLDDFELDQLQAVVEHQWDTDSYPIITDDEIKFLKRKGEVVELRPYRHIKKRRFQITLDDLRDNGVDIDKMLNKETFYSPELEPISKTFFHDKLKNRYARKSDGFNILAPIIVPR